MDDRPFSALPYPDRHGLHNPPAVGGTVARLQIHMQAGQAIGAVVPMLASRSGGHHRARAHLAGEAVGTGVSFIIIVFVLLPLVFAVHVKSS
ncbi:hypothetical protein SDC9_203579 [bioreactor metagenome]|uniref:Uncharacterized protein n=1 Tax=bioreactor metagenome TaxID=1076179 RepID=A0A645IWU8_9ZZZZ